MGQNCQHKSEKPDQECLGREEEVRIQSNGQICAPTPSPGQLSHGGLFYLSPTLRKLSALGKFSQRGKG